MIPHMIRVLTVSGPCVYATPHRESGHAVYSGAPLKSAVSGPSNRRLFLDAPCRLCNLGTSNW